MYMKTDIFAQHQTTGQHTYIGFHNDPRFMPTLDREKTGAPFPPRMWFHVGFLHHIRNQQSVDRHIKDLTFPGWMTGLTYHEYDHVNYSIADDNKVVYYDEGGEWIWNLTDEFHYPCRLGVWRD